MLLTIWLSDSTFDANLLNRGILQTSTSCLSSLISAEIICPPPTPPKKSKNAEHSNCLLSEKKSKPWMHEKILQYIGKSYRNISDLQVI